MNNDFDQIRAYERHQIQQLQGNIEDFQRNSEADRELSIQQEELIKQLQVRVHLAKVTEVEVEAFQAQALEVHEKLELSQQNLFMKVEVVQSCYWVA